MSLRDDHAHLGVEFVRWLLDAVAFIYPSSGEWLGAGIAGDRLIGHPLRDDRKEAIRMSDDPDAVAVSQAIPVALADAAEMLWVVLASVSGGDWTKQTLEWREAAARWRDNYFAALKVFQISTALVPQGPPGEPHCLGCEKGLPTVMIDEDGTRTDISKRQGIPSHAVDDAWWPCAKWQLTIPANRAADVDRLGAQAREISAMLAAAGIGSCPILEGVRKLIQRSSGSARTPALDALIAQWREDVIWEAESNMQYAAGLDQCADELAAALRPDPALPDRKESS